MNPDDKAALFTRLLEGGITAEVQMRPVNDLYLQAGFLTFAGTLNLRHYRHMRTPVTRDVRNCISEDAYKVWRDKELLVEWMEYYKAVKRLTGEDQ